MTEEEKSIVLNNMTEHLLVLRTLLRLSQADLAKMIGVSRQTLVAVENKKRPLSWNTFLSLLLIFSKNPSSRQLLTLYGIYTDTLDLYLSPQNTLPQAKTDCE